MAFIRTGSVSNGTNPSIVFTDRKKGISKMNGNIIWEALYGVLDLRIKDFFKKQNGNSTD